MDLPLLEFDPTRDALIEPSRILRPLDLPPRCVLCFFQEVIAQLVAQDRVREVTHLRSEIGPNPIYELVVNDQRLVLVHPGVGAPLAAGFLEELIALGCRRFIACGGSGVLDGAISLGQVIVFVSAVRDEGTSYHYLPPSREVSASPEAVTAIEATLRHHHVPYRLGKTWTTDALYRETRARIERRRAEGCLTVEMEAAAFFAVARFRDVTFGQLVYAGDDISGDNWDHRDWQHQPSSREKLFWLAVESCLLL